MNDNFLIDFEGSQREDQLLQDFSRIDKTRMSIAHKSPGLGPNRRMGHLSDLQSVFQVGLSRFMVNR